MRRRAIRPTLLILALACFAKLSPSICAGEDVVTLRPTSPGSPATKVRGNVLDYTGQELTLQTPTGPTSIASDKIDFVETDYRPDYLEAKKLLVAGQSNEAIRLLQQAATTETRAWVRRQILADTAIAMHNAGRIVEAGNTYLQIVAEDPQTQWIAAMPLSWFSLAPDFDRDRVARQWLQQSTVPQAQLLGASWLLSTSDRSQATNVLNTLRRNPSPQIAMLAEAQLWQTKVVTATAPDVKQWEKQLEAGVLREAALAGPYLVVGKAWRQLDNDTQAALALMRPPILYPTHRPVAAESLLQAGRSLERAGQKGEAIRVLREVLEKYGDQPARQEADIFIKRLAGAGSN
ncbi:tetratricopeptide repeat protein [Bremerella cremea]|uniref:tetratricopeptide repeat protein n=1 Tax=Bremerella cremea TaxID=1031537 RepID=UPI0031ECF5B5